MRRLPLFLLFAGLALAQSPDEFFETRIRPLLAEKCQGCHGAKVQMADLNLMHAAGVAKVLPRLLPVIGYEERVKMPPSGKLKPEEIAAFKQWIDAGAKWPDEAVVSEAPAKKAIGHDHWAFRALQRPTPPTVQGKEWVRNPIDQFILARLEEKGLAPAAPATKAVLLRRVTYDLTGLPPSSAEMAAFEADRSPDAFANVVDRLLAAPQYGEKWGRHWLDVARYADSTGMDEDHMYPHAWRYRDYVVNAFNQDLPYDRFVTQQLAGDLEPGQTGTDGIVATGFLALGPKPLAQQDRRKMVYDVVDEQIDTTSKVFMGLTVACARCHDHKFDPILTKDYYSLASIFASTVAFRNMGRPGAVSYIHYTPLQPQEFAAYQAHRTRLYAKQMEMEEVLAEHFHDVARRRAAELRGYLSAAVEVADGRFLGDVARERQLDVALLDKWVCHLYGEPTRLEAIRRDPAKEAQAYVEALAKWEERLAKWRKTFAEEARLDRDLPARPEAEPGPLFEVEDSPKVAALRGEWQALQKSLPPEPAMASAVIDGESVQQTVFVRGDHNSPGEPVAKAFPLVLAKNEQPQIEHGSGRLALAQWLTKPDHPLTSRVMVNRIWQWHFGEGLVRTPNNWGLTGEAPTHTELLDWLAREFVNDGWSIKALHRKILLSNTYQMGSQPTPQAREADPANRLWSRFNRRRLTIEEIRDSLLSLDGALDLERGGSLVGSRKEKRPAVKPDESRRRTLYLPIRRGSMLPLLSMFDFGDATTSNEGRSKTNVAPQALFMMNSEFVRERTTSLAEKLLSEASASDAERASQAVERTFGRKPSAQEVDVLLTYIGETEKRLNGSRAQAWQSLCHVLVSNNEFVYLD